MLFDLFLALFEFSQFCIQCVKFALIFTNFLKKSTFASNHFFEFSRLLSNVISETNASVICLSISNQNVLTLFENHQKCLIWIFLILVFSTNFCPFKIDRSCNTAWPQGSRFKKLAKLSIVGILNELLSTRNVNIHSSLRSQCWMRLFQTPCVLTLD